MFTARDSPFKFHNYCFLLFSNWISTLNLIRIPIYCFLWLVVVVARFAPLDNQQQSTIVDMREYETANNLLSFDGHLWLADNTSPIMLSMPQSCHLTVSLNWIERILNNFISSSSSLLLSVPKQQKMSTGDYWLLCEICSRVIAKQFCVCVSLWHGHLYAIFK